MSEDLYLCQKEIRRLRCVVRTYEAQMRELESYLMKMAEKYTFGDEILQIVREIADVWQKFRED